MNLALGCGPLPDSEALDAAWDGGIRHFDTAPSYGDGVAEEALGRALLRWPGSPRVSTKVGRVRMAIADPYGAPDGPRREPLFDFRAEAVRESILRSLALLGPLDTVLVHDPDAAVDLVVAETLPVLRELRSEGLFRAIGVGTTSVDTARRLVSHVDVVMIAGAWSLTRRSALPLLDECLAAGVEVLAAAPFDSGLLASDTPSADARYLYRDAPAEIVELAQRMAGVCRDHGVSLPQAAVWFPLRHPAVSTVVAGMRTAAEVHRNLDLMARPVPDALWADLLP
ncbi:aldo/keto reductase [Amycolatopsis sp. NPDC098790]|uniref:aldo/keto reductase n=1 Tax=Amycolatopsis sp. NPDC098790 TaxID=3363939 RepID=UPI0037F5A66A